MARRKTYRNIHPKGADIFPHGSAVHEGEMFQVTDSQGKTLIKLGFAEEVKTSKDSK